MTRLVYYLGLNEPTLRVPRWVARWFLSGNLYFSCWVITRARS